MTSVHSSHSFNCLSIDLEIDRHQRIRAFAGVRSDTNLSLKGAARDLAKLDALADGARFLLGHNLIDFDLPHLRAAQPTLRLLRLPALDTLKLSPLSFPRNPYHRLVKHYKNGDLQGPRPNDPELDARIALELFSDEQRALRDATPDRLTAWHWLTTRKQEAGFDAFFASIRNAPRPSPDSARNAIRRLLQNAACPINADAALNNPENDGWPLAYVLAWLSVAGGNSVMPPWVRHQFPQAGLMVTLLRDSPCGDSACGFCSDRHDARKELRRWFGFNDFRPEPADNNGASLQRSIADAAMAGKHALGIMPTGAGKSICYQLPALSRYDKTGALTVVISPLVALMADQVENLKQKGIASCVAINGLLSPPERAEALDRVRLGDASILIIAPEQLRSVAVRNALNQREIGAWMLDEAHCLSKWGHDFRPDYRYVARFIKQRTGETQPLPPILCLTATATLDVRDEIKDYFKKELGVELHEFNGGARRENLDFEVQQTTGADKLNHIRQLIEDGIPNEDGGAIVYCSTRNHAREVAELLQSTGLQADYFHGGLTPERKKDVQQRFINDDLRVISATNAFGMGIDKSNVRLVIHADIPGSLENYLQEAGRAGRDQQAARCVLLYTKEDVERQFTLSARSRLTRRDIHAVLKALRNLDRRKRLNGEVVATSGEILLGDDHHDFERDSATDDTRVRTAVSWLEEAQFLSREANETRIFPQPQVQALDEAREKLADAPISDDYRRKLLDLTRELLNASPDDGVSTDELMAAAGLSPEGVRNALYDLEKLGVSRNITALTAFVHAGVPRSSRQRFEESAAIERDLIQLLQETCPDMARGDSSPLNIRLLSQQLKDKGHPQALPERVRAIIRSIAADGRGEGGEEGSSGGSLSLQGRDRETIRSIAADGRGEGGEEGSSGGSLSLQGRDRETIRVTLQREWKDLEKTAERRRAAADRELAHLLSKLQPQSRGADLLVESSLSELQAVVSSDLLLQQESRDPRKLMERALLWMHELEIIRLNKGLAVFRSAMTIRLIPGKRGFAESDFKPLRLHYDAQTLQVHVMMEYAQRGLQTMAEALRMTMDYFTMGAGAFLRRWLPDRNTELQTTPESWNAICESLNNPLQRRIVADDRERANILVLAGPGSGKTRTLVHRIAYLVRVRRENPRGILALAYNRHAAVDIRRRLADLIGDDAKGVLVLTCHALAMRLVGASFAKHASNPDDERFREILRNAVSLLRGDGLPPEEIDDQRARLLAGFRRILVDEYQDIGPDEYNLISALAGRTLPDADDKLTLFAVGDDDQNIYAFKGSSVEFIRRFERDYNAKPAFLTGNYRSTQHIISAANAVIDPGPRRMKARNPIAINPARRNDPPGGEWTRRDPVAKGRVQILPAANKLAQAQAAVAELQRLAALHPGWNWSSCAVIARSWSLLHPVRALCELEGIPVQAANEDFTGIWRLRETQALVAWLRDRKTRCVASADLRAWLSKQPPGPWIELLREAVEEHALDTDAADPEIPVDSFIEWLAEWTRDARRRQRGLLLLTAHRAKGLEFDHVVVLDGGWRDQHDIDAERRLYYVAMTRARTSLALARLIGRHPFHDRLQQNPSVLVRQVPPANSPAPPELARVYRTLSLRKVFLSFAGYKPHDDPVHRAIASLSPGDPLAVHERERWELTDPNGRVVGQLAHDFKPPTGMKPAYASVYAIATWARDLSEPRYQTSIRRDSWEVVIPELVFEPAP